jgi:TetR/AcrR family transcriptional repressor of nem operon
VGVQEICNGAGVQKGSLYHFFASKDDLALAVMDRHWQTARQEFWKLAFARDLPPLSRIRRFFDMAYYHAADVQKRTGELPGCAFGNAVAELGNRHPALLARIQTVFSDGISHIQATLDEAVQAGEVPPGDTRARAEAIWAYFEGLVLLARGLQDPEILRCLGRNALLLAAGS